MQKDHARLADAWRRAKAERVSKGLPPLLQKELALKHSVTPGMIGHYLKGREPLNLKWKVRFAEFLGKPILSIWPDFEHKSLLSSGLPPDALEVALDYLEINDEAGKEAVRKMIAALPRRPQHKRSAQ